MVSTRQLDERWPRRLTYYTRCGCKRETYEAGGSRRVLQEIRVPMTTRFQVQFFKEDPSRVEEMHTVQCRDFVLEAIDFDPMMVRYDLIYRERDRS